MVLLMKFGIKKKDIVFTYFVTLACSYAKLFKTILLIYLYILVSFSSLTRPDFSMPTLPPVIHFHNKEVIYLIEEKSILYFFIDF